MIKMTIQDTEETAEFKVLEKPLIQKPLIAESDVVTIDNNLSTYVTGTQKRELTVGLGYLDSIGYETLRRIRDRQYAVLKYPTVTITADEPVDLGYGEDVPDYRQRLVQLKGKNLYGGSIYKENYVISTNGTESPATSGVITTAVKVEPNTTYTASVKWGESSPDKYMRVGVYTSDMTFISRPTSPASGAPTTFTTPANAQYVRLSYFIPATEVQLELGSTATTYEPYTNIELCKIGDYQDYIYKSGDKWYVHKETGKVDLGELTWTATTNIIRGSTGATGIKYAPNKQTIMPAYAERYSVRQGSGLSNNIGWMAVDTNKINVNTNGATDPTGLFYYQLATPTDTEIANDTLKAQLDALQNSAFDRWTKVETNVQEPSLQPYLTVTQGEITDSGKEVMLEGTTEDLLDFVILGDTFQQTYTGKNLFKVQATADVTSGVTYTKLSDTSFSITATGQQWARAWIALPNNLAQSTSYTIKFNYSASPDVSFVRVTGRTSSSEVFSRDIVSGTAVTVSTRANDVSIIAFYISTNNSYTGTVTISDFQLEPGTSYTSFEPYVGGVPAPNPSYPQEVQTVNGSVNFDFSGPSGVKKYTMVGKMALADQRIIDNCGTNEQVQVSFRESKQL